MPEAGASQLAAALLRAVGQGDLVAAAANCRALQASLIGLMEPALTERALSERELIALRSQLRRCHEQACALRDGYAARLRNTVRGRRKIDAYRGAAGQR